MPPSPLRPSPVLLRAALGCALLGTAAALARAQWRPLREVLAARGMHVVGASMHWLDGPGLGARRVLFLAREGASPSELYVATARTGNDRVVSLRELSNLSRSPNASEEGLVVAGRYAAFVTRVRDEVVAVNVLDTQGEAHATERRWDARLRGAITRLQQTGRTQGYGMDRYDLLPSPHAVRLAWQGERLAVYADGAAEPTAVLDAPHARALSGGEHVRQRPRLSAAADNWLTWAVDTARAVPWIGPTPIRVAETMLFRTRTIVQQARISAVGVTDTRQEVAEDLEDVLAAARSASAQALEGPVSDWPPAGLHGAFPSPSEHEGEWAPIAAADDPFVQSIAGAPTPMYLTYVRSDRERSDLRVYVALWDPRMVELHVAPGSQEPMGATGETGSGAIPRDEHTITHLLGGFNGAFQGLHGEYGVFAEGALLLPPKPYAATVALMADGSTGFGSWPAEQATVPDELLEFRQNLTALVDNGQYNPWRRGDWGAVLNNPGDLRSARSGLCLTREHYVAYLWGNDLHPRALADAMIEARCTYGIHLDMNGPNTGFELYRAGRAGTLPPLNRRIVAGYEAEGSVDDMPGYAFRGRKLVRSMPHRPPRYIERNPRDFFYLQLRDVLPGAPVAPVLAAQPGEGSWHVAGLGEQPFPWPMARTRLRPDAAQPERWVNLVRVDARRVQLAPAAGDASTQGAVVASLAGAQVAHGPGGLRLTMSSGNAGPRWVLGTDGDGVAGEALVPGASALRAACVDHDGYLVVATADRPVPDLVSRALERAGCTGTRIALPGVSIVLPSGQAAGGESVTPQREAALVLRARPWVGARQLFPEVTAVAPSVWRPVQDRRVRYFPNPGNNVTVQVRLAGQQSVVLSLPGIGQQFLRAAYPDGGIPPSTLRGN